MTNLNCSLVYEIGLEIQYKTDLYSNEYDLVRDDINMCPLDDN